MDGYWSDIGTLISYYDTNLINSAMTGGLSQFQENYWANTTYPARSFLVRNIYAYDRIAGDWLSLDKTLISYDPPEWGFNTAGTHEFGATRDFFWGQAGVYVSDQASYDASHPRNVRVGIVQPEKPEMPPSEILGLRAEPSDGQTEILWDVSDFGAPVIRFDIRLSDIVGNTLLQGSFTRPETERIRIAVPYTSVGKIIMKTTDVYGVERFYETKVR